MASSAGFDVERADNRGTQANLNRDDDAAVVEQVDDQLRPRADRLLAPEILSTLSTTSLCSRGITRSMPSARTYVLVGPGPGSRTTPTSLTVVAWFVPQPDVHRHSQRATFSSSSTFVTGARHAKFRQTYAPQRIHQFILPRSAIRPRPAALLREPRVANGRYASPRPSPAPRPVANAHHLLRACPIRESAAAIIGTARPICSRRDEETQRLLDLLRPPRVFHEMRQREEVHHRHRTGAGLGTVVSSFIRSSTVGSAPVVLNQPPPHRPRRARPAGAAAPPPTSATADRIGRVRAGRG